MPVFRVDKSRDFTVVANCVFKDRSLSAKAKGILVEMLSLPESWDYTLKGLTALFSDGIDSIRQGINELRNMDTLSVNVSVMRAVGLEGWSMSFTRRPTNLWKTRLILPILNRQNLQRKSQHRIHLWRRCQRYIKK